jgi:hypothetical protein
MRKTGIFVFMVEILPPTQARVNAQALTGSAGAGMPPSSIALPPRLGPISSAK